MKNVHFTWLHLTDFHLNVTNKLWLDIKSSFFKDLKNIYNKCDFLDLILVTGDLAQRGDPKEFEEAGNILEEIRNELEKLGSLPQILIVPGEHDLKRVKNHNPVVENLKGIAHSPQQIEKLCEKESKYHREIIKEITNSFENYDNKVSKKYFPASSEINNLIFGIFPGDFSITIPKGGAKLGIVGLNTAFIQLADGDYKDKLFLHSCQFHEACGGDGQNWARKHHVCLLMTHHPVAYLDEKVKRQFEEYIGKHFTIHLCGHVHDANLKPIGDRGRPVIWISSGCSLFGAELKEEKTSCGYTVGRIGFFVKETRGNFILWPRRKNCGGFSPDSNIYIDEDEHTQPKYFELGEPFKIGPERPPPQSRREQKQRPVINNMSDNNSQNEEDNEIIIEKKIENFSNNRGVKSNKNIPSSLPQLTLKEKD